MKKADRLQMRGEPAEMEAFRNACASAGLKASAVMRHLCRAAIPYMATYCQGGTWYPPRLVPDVPAAALRMVAEDRETYKTREGEQRPDHTASRKRAPRVAR